MIAGEIEVIDIKDFLRGESILLFFIFGREHDHFRNVSAYGLIVGVCEVIQFREDDLNVMGRVVGQVELIHERAHVLDGEFFNGDERDRFQSFKGFLIVGLFRR